MHYRARGLTLEPEYQQDETDVDVKNWYIHSAYLHLQKRWNLHSRRQTHHIEYIGGSEACVQEYETLARKRKKRVEGKNENCSDSLSQAQAFLVLCHLKLHFPWHHVKSHRHHDRDSIIQL